MFFYRCDEMMVSFTDNIDKGHIAEMNKRKGKHYAAGHAGNAAHQCSKTGNRLPETDHYGSVAKVQQVVAGKQHPVKKTSKFFVPIQQCNDVHAAIAVEKPAGTHGNKIGNKKIDDVCQRIHDGSFYHSAFSSTNLPNIFIFSNISENIVF